MTIEVTDLKFSYRTEEVLKGISFFASEGKLLCVLGKNGAGKSTLFRCILGLLRNYGGGIRIDGVKAADLSTRELAKKVSYIPQNHATVYAYSVLDMVMMGTTVYLGRFQNPGRKQRAAAEKALETMKIPHLKDRSFSEISGGEQQMVLIARALAQQTKILIMDEPCSNLDYGNQIRLMRALKELAKQGYLVIQSTHNPEHVFLFADEVLVIREGIVEAMGDVDRTLTEELLQRVYGVKVNLHEMQGTHRKFCIPDEKEISYRHNQDLFYENRELSSGK